MKKKMLIIAGVSVLVIALAGCSLFGKKEEKKEEPAGKPTVSDAYAAYKEVLIENKNQINNYTWALEAQRDAPTIKRQTSLADINGDDIPELFFFSAKDDTTATLHIYTYEDGKAQEVKYSYIQQGTKSSSSKDSYTDNQESGECKYVIYKSEGQTGFSILGGMTKGILRYTLNQYDTSKGLTGKLTSTSIANVFDPYEQTDVYYSGDNKISSADGKSKFSEAFKGATEIIMYSGYDTNCSIWEKVSPDSALSKSYDDMIDYLESN